MSAEPTERPDAAPDDAPPRRPLWRRLLKWTLVSFGVLLLLVALAIVFFHLPPGKAIVRGLAEDAAADLFHGEVTLGELDYTLFGDIAIVDLRIKDPAGQTALHLKRLDLSLDWGAMVGGGELVIDRLAVDGVVFDSAAMLATEKEPFALPQGDGVTVRALDVKNVDVTLTQPDGSVARIDGLTVTGSLAANNREHTADVAIERLAFALDLTRPDGTRITVPLATGLNVTRRGDDLRVVTREITTTARVERPGEPPIDAPLRVGALTLTARPGLAQVVFDGLTAGPLALERLEADARLTAVGAPVGTQRLAVTGLTIAAADANALLGQELLLSDLRADLLVAGPPNALVVTGDVTTDGGILALRGTVDVSALASPAYDLRLTGADIDTARLLAGDDQPRVTTSMLATIKGKGARPGAVDADVHFELGPTEVGDQSIEGVTLDATARGQVLTLTGLTISALGQELLITGALDQGTRRFEGRAQSGMGLRAVLAQARDAGLLIVPLPAIAGTLDVDLALAGVLKTPAGGEAEAAAAAAAPPLERLPFESLTIKGHADAGDVRVTRPEGDLQVTSARLEVDVAVAEEKPTGTISVRITGIDAGAAAIEGVDIDVVIDGLEQRTTIAVRDAPQRLRADVALDTRLDPDTRTATVTLQRLELERGAFATALLEPVTLSLAPPDPDGTLTMSLPNLRLSAAGGTVSVGGRARFVPDPDNPGANRLQHATGALELDGLSIGQLAALGRRSTRGLSGTLSGSLGFDGTPEDPSATFGLTVRARARGASPALVRVQGSIREGRLAADVRVTDAASSALLAQLKVAAPLALGPGAPPGLAPGGRLSVDLDVPRRRLAAFGALLPGGLPPGVDPNAELAARAKMTGTPARPTGSFELTLEGALIQPVEGRDLPRRQRLAVRADLAPAGAVIGLTSRLDAWLDAAAAPLVTVTTAGRFTRSPLLARGMARPWHLETTLSPVDLARLPLPERVRGTVGGSLSLDGDATDLLAQLRFAANGVQAGDAPTIDATGAIDLERDTTRVAMGVKANALDVLTVDGTLGVAGAGLQRTLRRRGALERAPLDLTVRVPKRSLAGWSALAPRPITLPGDFGGALAITGTLGAPLADGALAWDGFTTLAGTPGRVALVIEATEDRVGGGLELGPRAAGVAPVTLGVGVARDQLAAPSGPLAVTLMARAADVDLLSLVPAGVIEGPPLDAAGRLDWDLDGRFELVRDADGVRLDAPASALRGALVIRDGRFAAPGSDRVMQDLGVRLDASNDALDLTMSVREADAQYDQRTARVAAKVTLVDFLPTVATLRVDTERFLVNGLAFDGPEGELDLGLTVTATRLLEPVKDVEVTIERVKLNAPERFVRAHYPQFTSYGDVVYLDEAGLASGKLAPPAVETPRPPPDPDAPVTGVDLRLRIPEPLDVLMDPLTLAVRGGMDVTMRGDDLHLSGRIDVEDGAINVMGWS